MEDQRDKISLYLYDELSVEERDRVEAEIETSAEFEAAVENERRFLEGLSARRDVKPPDGLLAECRQDLMRAVYHEQPPVAQTWLQGFFGMFGGGLGFMSKVTGPRGILAGVASNFSCCSRQASAMPPTPIALLVRNSRRDWGWFITCRLRATQRCCGGLISDVRAPRFTRPTQCIKTRWNLTTPGTGWSRLAMSRLSSLADSGIRLVWQGTMSTKVGLQYWSYHIRMTSRPKGMHHEHFDLPESHRRFKLTKPPDHRTF